MSTRKILFISFLALLIASQATAAGLVPCGGSPRCCDTGEIPVGAPPSCVVAPCGGSPLPRCCDPGEPAGHLGCVVSTCEPRCQLCHFFVMAQRIVNFVLFTIVPPLSVLMIVISGAFFILGSGYDPSLIQKGKDMLKNIAIGLLIIYGAWIFVNTFFVLIGLANTEFGNRIGDWFVFPCPGSSSSLPASFTANPNAQMTTPGDTAFFVGVDQPAVGEDIPLPF